MSKGKMGVEIFDNFLPVTTARGRGLGYCFLALQRLRQVCGEEIAIQLDRRLDRFAMQLNDEISEPLVYVGMTEAWLP